MKKPLYLIVFHCTEVNGTDTVVSPTTPYPRPHTSASNQANMTAPTTPAHNSSAVEGQVRLVNGNSSCAGRVEIFHSGQWGTVCDDSWGVVDAQVVCRQLGCGRVLSAPSSAAFGPGSGPIWMDDVRCTGSESKLTQCSHQGFGSHNCGHHEDASVVCEGKCTFSQLKKMMSHCVTCYDTMVSRLDERISVTTCWRNMKYAL